MSDVDTLIMTDLESVTDMEREQGGEVDGKDDSDDDKTNDGEIICGTHQKDIEYTVPNDLIHRDENSDIDIKSNICNENDDTHDQSCVFQEKEDIKNVLLMSDVSEHYSKNNGETGSVNGRAINDFEICNTTKSGKNIKVNNEDGSISSDKEMISVPNDDLALDAEQNNNQDHSSSCISIETLETSSPHKQTSLTNSDFTNSEGEDFLTKISEFEKEFLSSHAIVDSCGDNKKPKELFGETSNTEDINKLDITGNLEHEGKFINTDKTIEPRRSDNENSLFGETACSDSDDIDKPLDEIDNTKIINSGFGNMEEHLNYVDNIEKSPSEASNVKIDHNVVGIIENSQAVVHNLEQLIIVTNDSNEKSQEVDDIKEQNYMYDNTENPQDEVDNNDKITSKFVDMDKQNNAANNTEQPQDDISNTGNMTCELVSVQEEHGAADNTEQPQEDIDYTGNKTSKVVTVKEEPSIVGNMETAPRETCNTEKQYEIVDRMEESHNKDDNMAEQPSVIYNTYTSTDENDVTEKQHNIVDDTEKLLHEADNAERVTSGYGNAEEQPVVIDNMDTSEKSNNEVINAVITNSCGSSVEQPCVIDNTEKPPIEVNNTEKEPSEAIEKLSNEIYDVGALANGHINTEQPNIVDNIEKQPDGIANIFDGREKSQNELDNIKEIANGLVNTGEQSAVVGNTETQSHIVDTTEISQDDAGHTETRSHIVDTTEISQDNDGNTETQSHIVDTTEMSQDNDGNTETQSHIVDTTEISQDNDGNTETQSHIVDTTEISQDDAGNTETQSHIVDTTEISQDDDGNTETQSHIVDTTEISQDDDGNTETQSHIVDTTEMSQDNDGNTETQSHIVDTTEISQDNDGNTETQSHIVDTTEISQDDAGNTETQSHIVDTTEISQYEDETIEQLNISDSRQTLQNEVDELDNVAHEFDNFEKQPNVFDNTEQLLGQVCKTHDQVENENDLVNKIDKEDKKSIRDETELIDSQKAGDVNDDVTASILISTFSDTTQEDNCSIEGITDNCMHITQLINDEGKKDDNIVDDRANHKRLMDRACSAPNGTPNSWEASTIAYMTIEQLQEQLEEQHSAMTCLQTHAHMQQVKSNLLTTSLRAKLRRKGQELRSMRHEHEQQMSAVLSHLLYLESHMMREHKEIINILQDKEDIIKRQKAALKDLTVENNRYLEELTQSHGYFKGNGVVKTLDKVLQEDDKISTVDHNNKVILRGSRHKQGEKPSGGGHKVRFSAMKDRLRRHKSSLELYQHEPLETLMESNLRYGSEENLVVGDSDEKSKILDRMEKCRSLVDYPVVRRDMDKGSIEHQDDCFNDFQTISRHDSTSSLVIFDENTTIRNAGLSSALAYGFTELSKSRSVPHALPTVSESDARPIVLKGRQKSLPSVEVLIKDIPATITSTISPSSSMTNLSPSRSPTSASPTDSNPFKSFKNVFKRKGSKKKRSLTLTSGKEQKEALKQHFDRFDLR